MLSIRDLKKLGGNCIMNQIVDVTMFIFKSDKMYNNCLYSYKTKFKVLAD